MEIYSSTIHGAQKASAPHRTAFTPPTASPPKESLPLDSIKFSEAASNVNSLDSGESSSSGIRFDLVNRIKREIAAGTYDTPDKMDIAMNRLLTRLTPNT